MIRKASFSPVIDERTRLLLLGSLPGEASLRAARYYAHPQNQFWQLVSAITGRDLVALPYDDRLQALLGAGIGLWDVVADAARSGSLDAAIRDHRTNDLAALIANLPELRAIGFNGATAARIGRRLIPATTKLALIDLPSSSPAFTIGLAAKRVRWLPLKAFLDRR
ncbi:G/U mismatch-specific uracil-DNA glycosylase [Sphingomonas sp. YR710]|jgi:hypoxanthine-DNA glycosylase|uniref:DNA-deoxyinosine glycosylase n=1 Tax=Sphingomonas sp. YR710 TaxID=1882773 RepID=UPI000884D6BA|nr:DNA-deoxyinosine glycosylase [Sphingomonas sp. YR710]SDC71701.1 G/U mismatch-specific uracil-DNA glycosylase [Sphingomonas sp. YR710]